MGVYAGRVNCRQLLNTLHNAMLAEGYQEISSDIATDGRVYKSTGIDGENEFYIRVQDPLSNYLLVGFYDKYTPGTPGVPGAFGNGHTQSCVTWNRSSTSNSLMVAYIFNINKDRVIIQCEGLKVNSGNCSSLTYIGMPKRYDLNDKNCNFGGIAGSTRMDSNNEAMWKALRGRNLAPNFWYEMDYYMPPRSYGWGNKIFFSPIFIGHDDEGPRGELSGLYTLEAGDAFEFQHYDTFKKDGKTYIILSRANDFNNNKYLPNSWYVMEVAEGLQYGLLFR
jgi:hypothetical protein